MSSELKPIQQSVRAAWRRLFAQSLLNHLVTGWSVALAIGLLAIVFQPLYYPDAIAQFKWYLLGGLVALGTMVSYWLAMRRTPGLNTAALEVDNRFNLKERVTTAFALSPEQLQTPVGQALVADAAKKVEPISVKEKFPVSPRWTTAFVPVLAIAIALAIVFPIPFIQNLVNGDEDPNGLKAKEAAKPEAEVTKKTVPFTQRNKPPELTQREDKSKELKELEEEINNLMRKFDTDPKRETSEKQKEKVAEITSLEEKTKKFAKEKEERLTKLGEQLQQLDRLNKDQEFQEGPAKKLNDALSKGDLKKAQEELDQLKKKLKENKLTEEEKEQLAKQFDKMKQELQKMERNKEREKQLEEAIKRAKEEGKNADALERELDQLKKDAKDCAECAQSLAQKMQKAQDALKKGDTEEAAKQLESAAKDLQKTEGDLKDLEDAQEYLQKLKTEKCESCKKCQGDKSNEEDAGRQDFGQGAGRASGLREENKDAKTQEGEEQRVRAMFDPRGKKTYGGSTKGPAFKKATTAELGEAIKTAAQDAPQATDSQRLPRDAKDNVKDYFQNLGGQTPGGK
jgi:tetratricopeptide (TPR) repeat protein